jgi:cytochrome c
MELAPEVECTMAKRVVVSPLVWLLCALALGATVLAQTPEPMEDRMAAPIMPENPTQADLGAQVYYQNCMACHGDRGQGLTDEWRAAWSEGDQNCWQAKCHAANHPPGGFELVRYVPPVVGEGLLAKFQNAAVLQAFISAQMPWENPGRLTEDESWQVTAFLLRSNGLNQDQEPLGPDNASEVSLAAIESQGTVDLPAAAPPEMPPMAPPEMPPPGRSNAAGWLVMGAVGLIVGMLIIGGVWLLRRARS